MEWRVSLTGDESDLDLLSETFRGPDLTVLREDDGFVLRSTRFSQSSSFAAVRDEAQTLIALLNGATRLRDGSQRGHRGVALGAIGSIGDDGSRNVYLSGSATAISRASARFTVVRADGTIEKPDPAPAQPALGWVQAALRSEAVAKVLRLLANKSPDWVNLYRILEVIEHDVGGRDPIARNKWATKNALRRFKHSANSPTAIGDNARHGKESTQPPTDPMTLPEAGSLIEAVVRSWLRTKQSGPAGRSG